MATSKYTRMRALVEISDVSGEYGAARREEVSCSRTDVTRWQVIRVDATTGGVTVELSQFTTVLNVVLANLDTTNYVELTWTYSASTRMSRCDAGDWIKICRPTVANDLTLTANTATCECEVWILGT